MEVALAESLQDYEKAVEDQERQVMQKTNAQFEEEQMMQMVIKESMKQEEELVEEVEGDEEEMLRRALEMSKGETNYTNQMIQ